MKKLLSLAFVFSCGFSALHAQTAPTASSVAGDVVAAVAPTPVILAIYRGVGRFDPTMLATARQTAPEPIQPPGQQGAPSIPADTSTSDFAPTVPPMQPAASAPSVPPLMPTLPKPSGLTPIAPIAPPALESVPDVEQ